MSEMNLSLHDLIVEIHELDRRLHALEEKYSLLSADFYQLYEDGRLQDDEIAEIDEWGRWAAWYRMRARRIAQYEVNKDLFFTENAQGSRVILKPRQALAKVA